MGNDVGISRRQRVFAVAESTRGVLAWPAAADFIRPSGDAVMNQAPEFKDSTEKADTLDVLDQFQNAFPPADWSLPFLVRAVDGAAPQADAVFASALGKKVSGSQTCKLSGALNNSAVLIPYKASPGLVGTWPEAGVVLIGTEKVSYAGIDRTLGKLLNCVRGYKGTTAASHVDDDTITLQGVVYAPNTKSPSFSLWIMTDHLVQFCAGCSPESLSFGVTNEGAAEVTVSGKGLKMGLAGTCVLAAPAAQAQAQVVVPDARIYSVGGRVWNVTKADDNAGAGYAITAINYTTNTLTLGTNLPTGGWATNDEVAGFLPAATVLGSTIENRSTAVYIAGAAGTMKTTDLKINTPKQFINDEVGTLYPSDYMEQPRSVESELKIYFRRDEAYRFKDGADGKEVSACFVFGSTDGKKMFVSLRRCKLKVPTINFAAPAVNLSIPFKALGTDGEDSVYIAFA